MVRSRRSATARSRWVRNRSSRPPSRWATMKRRARRCGAPTSDARRSNHSASRPSAARSERMPSSPRVRRPGTFSMTVNAGSSSAMTRRNSGQSHRGSSAPRRAPATLTGWQGKPPQRTLIASTFPRFTSCTEPKSFVPGNRARSRRLQNGSISDWNTMRVPSPSPRASPFSRPAMPEKSEPIAKLLTRAFASSSAACPRTGDVAGPRCADSRTGHPSRAYGARGCSPR